MKSLLRAAQDVVDAMTREEKEAAITVLRTVLSRQVDLDEDLSSLSRAELEGRVRLLRALYQDALAGQVEAKEALDEIHEYLLDATGEGGAA